MIGKWFTRFTVLLMLMLALSPSSSQAAMVTFEFDDGWASQWEAFEILSRHRQVGVAAVPAHTLIFKDYFKDTVLSLDQLKAMQKTGWEVASHSVSHPHFNKIPQTMQEALLSGWTKAPGRQHTYYTHSPHRGVSLVQENGKLLKRCLSVEMVERTPGSFLYGRDTGIVYVHPSTCINPGHCLIGVNSVEWEIQASHNILKGMGLNVKNLAVPYHEWSAERMVMAQKVYNSSGTGLNQGNRVIFNPIPAVEPQNLCRLGIAKSNSVEWIKKYVLQAIEKERWVILLFHRVGENGPDQYFFSPTKLDELATWIAEQKIDVVTRQQGMDRTIKAASK